MDGSPGSPRAKKRFGQNFLVDEGVVQSILHGIDARSDEEIVEIGPGLGALTGPLLATGARVTAIEIDRDLVARLGSQLARHAGFKLVEADALSFDISGLGLPRGSIRLVGNLPYNISTPLLLHLVDQAILIRDMHFMVQKEVALRLAAPPDCGDFGRLSIAVQATCRVEVLFDVAPESFRPAPAVWSSIVRLEPLPTLPSRPVLDALEEISRVAFMHRRKMLRHTLGSLFEADELAALGIALTMRAENIPVDAYLALARLHAARRSGQVH